MLDSIEHLMTVVRRVKLFVTAAAIGLPLLAGVLLKMTEGLLRGLVAAGNQMQNGMIRDEVAAFVILVVLGYVLRKAFKAGKESSLVADLMASFVGGILGFCLIFYLLPTLAHTIAQVIVAPALVGLGQYFGGEAVVSLKTILKILLAGYLATWVIDVLITRYLRKQDIARAVERLLRRYGKELVECVEDLQEFFAWLYRSLFGRKSREE
jgi:hypothetical protein